MTAHPGLNLKRMPSPGRRSVRAAGHLLIGFLCGLGCMEGAVRGLGIDIGQAEPGVIAHPLWGRWHRANFAFRYRRAETGATHSVRFNEHGMRDSRSIAVARPPGTLRVAVLGDSYVEAVHVPEEETVCRRLEAYLQARSSRRVEVLNFACSGFSTAAELVQVREWVRAFSPQVVVCFHHFTDITEDWAFTTSRERAARLAVRSWHDHFAERVRATADRSQLFRVLRRKLKGLDSAEQQSARADGPALCSLQSNVDAIVHDPYTPDDERAWDHSLGLLGEMAELLRGDGIALLVVAVPIISQVEPLPKEDAMTRGARYLGDGGRLEYRGYQEHLTRCCREQGIACLDLLDEFRAANPSGQPWLFLPRELHWSQAGHDLAAKAVATRLALPLFSCAESPRPQ
jgi:SGNH hydrolase-like domain, acetyltransferase AlgX